VSPIKRRFEQNKKTIFTKKIRSKVRSNKSKSSNNCWGWKHAICVYTGSHLGNKCHPTKDGHGGTNSQVEVGGVTRQYYQCEGSILKNPIAMIYGWDYSCMYGDPNYPAGNWDPSLGLDYYTGRPGCDYLGMHEDYCYSNYDNNTDLETGTDYNFSNSTNSCSSYTGTAASGCQPYTLSNGTEQGFCECGGVPFVSERSCSDMTSETECQACHNDGGYGCQPVNVITNREDHPENHNSEYPHYANDGRLAGRSFNRTNCTWVYDNFCSANPEWTTVSCSAAECQSQTMGIIDPDTFGPGNECLVDGCGYLLGDLNNDCYWNVGDIVTLANCVLNDSCGNNFAYTADVNQDGSYNVVDIVTLANCILGDNCCNITGNGGCDKDAVSKHLPPPGMTKSEQNKILRDILNASKDINKINSILKKENLNE